MKHSPCLVFLLVLLLLLPAGCASKGGRGGKGGWFSSWFKRQGKIQGLDESAEKKAREAMDYFQRGRFLLAEELFQKVKDRYPFSPYATLAELRLADCKFYSGEYEAAIPLYEEFERLHPTNEAVPYVIFMQGTAYYRLMDTPDRDQTFTKKMIETYQRLLRRFPDNPYRLEAKRRIEEGRELLAQHEIVVVKWYMRVDMLPQAKHRLLLVREKYPDTQAALEAQRLLAEVERSMKTAKASSLSGELPEGAKKSWWDKLKGIIP